MIFSIIFGIVIGSWLINKFGSLFDWKNSHHHYISPPDDIFPKEEFDWEKDDFK